MQAKFGLRGRKVSQTEKCRMLGVCPCSVSGMSESAVETALGNCIAVPSMAQVLWPVMMAWMLMRRDDVSQMFFGVSDDEDEKSNLDAWLFGVGSTSV